MDARPIANQSRRGCSGQVLEYRTSPYACLVKHLAHGPCPKLSVKRFSVTYISSEQSHGVYSHLALVHPSSLATSAASDVVMSRIYYHQLWSLEGFAFRQSESHQSGTRVLMALLEMYMRRDLD